MLNISGYLGPSSEIPIVDNQTPIVVSSCGHYRFSREEALGTTRSGGPSRLPAAVYRGGIARFQLMGQEHILPEGHTVLYRPGEAQRYTYEKESAQEVYWIHFSGRTPPSGWITWGSAAIRSARWVNTANTPACLSKSFRSCSFAGNIIRR